MFVYDFDMGERTMHESSTLLHLDFFGAISHEINNLIHLQTTPTTTTAQNT